jgi:hypothetical protein
VKDRIQQLCKQIAQETDPETVQQLIQELHFQMMEQSLHAQNKAFQLSHLARTQN